MAKKYFRVRFSKDAVVQGKRVFWMEVISESDKFVVGWEMTEDGDRTHRQHIIQREAATFVPARMNHTYATMEEI